VALGRLDEALESGPTIEARTVMILVEWPSREAFQAFLDDPDLEDLHPLREGGTRNYLWWTYERLEDLRPLFQA
jgi:heme-degrading monooxygenase HmoA